MPLDARGPRIALFLFLGATLAGQTLNNPRPSGVWLRGDTHVHDDHSSDGSQPRQRNRDRAAGNVSIADQIDQATRMGLEFLPLTDHRTYDQHYDPLWESSAILLLPAEEANGSPHATVLGGTDSIVQGAARKDRAPFTHVQQSVWDAHSQDAVWSVAHADDGEMDAAGNPNANASVQGIDLVEIWNRAKNAESQITYAEALWNAGFRFGVAGASDSHFRERWDVGSPGMPMTSVFATAYNERGVLDGLRAGHTTLSASPTGPFVTLATDLDGGRYEAIDGDEVIARAGAAGHLRVSTRRAVGLQVIVYRNPGRSAGALATFVPRREDETFIVDVTARAQPDWYRVEVRAPSSAGASSGPGELRAATSPIFVSPVAAMPRPQTDLPLDAGLDAAATLVAGTTGAFSGFPDVAKEGATLHVVAEQHGDASSTIVYRRRDARGAWSDGRALSGAGLGRFPRVAARDNDVWVVWQEDALQVPHRPKIRLRHSPDRGATWQEVQMVRALDGRAEHPAIAIARTGRPVVVWQEIARDQPMDVMAVEIGADPQPVNLSRAGKRIDPGTASDSRSPRYPASVLPAVAIAADGRLSVAWQDNRSDPDPGWTGTAAAGEGTNPDNWNVMVATRDVRGGWRTPVELGADDLADRHPDLTFDSAGNLVVVWESKALRSSGANLSVRAAVSSNGGATFSTPVIIAPDTQTMSERPRLGVDTDGSVRAVWYDSRSADWRWRVMTAVYRAGAWSAGTLLDGRGNNTWPATAGDEVVFASTRNAARLQRDSTQQIFVLRVK